MKKITVLCAITCFLISTTTFGMLTTKTCAKQFIKKNNPTQLCNKRTAHIDAFHAQLLNKTMKDNERLAQENEILRHKVKFLSKQEFVLELTDERAAMPGKAKDRDFEHGNMNKE